jgi:hypothetical protein
MRRYFYKLIKFVFYKKIENQMRID